MAQDWEAVEMEFETFDILGPALIKPKTIGDERGYFCETFRDDWFKKNIACVDFLQDNQSLSAKAGTLRGLHYQKSPMEQGKLVRCINGEIFDVAVDIRNNSPTFGKWIGINLSAKNGYQLWIPPGFLHGFCTFVENCVISYKTTQYYCAEHDAGIAFDDAQIGVIWPFEKSKIILSAKDQNQPQLASLK